MLGDIYGEKTINVFQIHSFVRNVSSLIVLSFLVAPSYSFNGLELLILYKPDKNSSKSSIIERKQIKELDFVDEKKRTCCSVIISPCSAMITLFFFLIIFILNNLKNIRFLKKVKKKKKKKNRIAVCNLFVF